MLLNLLGDSWSFFKNNFFPLAYIVFPIIIPVEILSSIYEYFYSSDEPGLSEYIFLFGINLLVYPIFMVGIIFYLASNIVGDYIDTMSLWRLGAKFWAPYLLIMIIVGVLIIVGLALLIIPGLILMARYAFAEFYLLLNQDKPLDAMRNSWYLTKEYGSTLLWGYLLIALLISVPSNMLEFMYDGETIVSWILYTLINALISFLSIGYTIFAFRVYEFARLNNVNGENND